MNVEGVVTSSWGVPLVPLKVYKVGDSSGEITVVSDGSRVPPRGARVRVKGKVTEFGTFGGRAVGLHLREQSLHVLRSRIVRDAGVERRVPRSTRIRVHRGPATAIRPEPTGTRHVDRTVTP